MSPATAVILRHGKAERESPTGHDPDRPLAERGVRQAGWMGRTLADAGLVGAAVVASPAARTWSTAQIVAEALGVEPVRDDRLFLSGTVSGVIELLAERAGDAGLVVVGHNPTISLAASVLTHGVGACVVSLRTGEAAVCELPMGATPGRGVLRGVWRLNDK